MTLDYEKFDQALRLLNGRLALAGAAVDQSGSYHAADLRELQPTDEELLAAAVWTRSHDPSDGYRQGLQWFLKEFGYEHLVARV